VLGEASLVPGSGETVIAFAAACAVFAAGTEVGSPAAGASPQAAIANALPTAAAPSAARQIQRLVLSRDWSLWRTGIDNRARHDDRAAGSREPGH
jgi:hypothetical protein